MDSGKAFADLSFWRKTRVFGPEAVAWLNGLASADVALLSPGRATRSLLLSPTGGVRAEFTVARQGEDLLLLQDPSQPQSVRLLLSPYILSSRVELIDQTAELALFSFPGASAPPPESAGMEVSAPSCLGAGVDLLAPASEHRRHAVRLARSFVSVGNEEVEAWRLRAGTPRVGVDVGEADLPQEAGMEAAVAFDKGCFLGQEAVARSRNLGHPRRVVLRFLAEGPVSPGDPVEVQGHEAGEVTSAARVPEGCMLMAKVRWDARGGPFRTRLGTELRPSP